MHARILTNEGIRFDGRIASLTTPTQAGEITILNHHHPIITALGHGIMIVHPEDEPTMYIEITSGVLHMSTQNEILVLLQ